MRITTVLAITVLTVYQQCYAAKPAYDGLVMTSVDVKELEGNKVEFSGRIEGKEDDTTAVFLQNVVEVRKEGPFWNRRPIFQAEQIEASEVVKSVKKPLLCIHGFNTEPEYHLEQCRQNKDKFAKFTLIPVIWPSQGGGLTNYFGDRGVNSKGGGKAFRTLTKFAGMFPRKSIMTHSMGNRVLRYAADAKFKFDNIFMVAADVNHRLFDEDYIEEQGDNMSEKERRDDGIRISKMLNKNKNGKIYVLHNNQDSRLLVSWTVLNGGIKRIGLSGARMDKIHPDIKDKVENINAGQKWLNWSRKTEHSYQFDKEAIEFMESKFND